MRLAERPDMMRRNTLHRTLLGVALLSASYVSGGCITPPSRQHSMTVVSVPEGATCTTAAGEQIQLPAVIDCASDGTTYVEVALAGYRSRRVEIVSEPCRPQGTGRALGELLGGLVGASVERVPVVDGVAVLELDALDAPPQN